MKKIIKWIATTLFIMLIIVILAGIYKFNYLSSQEGYDCDGNKIIHPSQNNDKLKEKK